MAGHSKWANIKHRKGAQDKKRAKIFTRILKEIHIAVKEGHDPSPDTNPRLRLAVQNAKGANIPDSENYENVNYEGYLPNGVAVFIEASTDNIQRTVANVRSIFNKAGGSLGTNGSLEFIFDHKGIFALNRENLGERNREELELQLIEGGAEEVEKTDELWIITTAFEDFGPFQQQLEQLELEAQSSELERIPSSTVKLDAPEALKILKAIDRFEEDDDVQNVFHTLEMTDELEAALDDEDS